MVVLVLGVHQTGTVVELAINQPLIMVAVVVVDHQVVLEATDIKEPL
jgi:hypothetical protein